MYKTISFLTVVFISLFILSEDVLAQSSYVFTCGTPNTAYNGPVIMDGQFKPVKTPPENDTSAYLRCLVVFAEFKDDNSYPTSQNWPPGEPPIYIDEMFAETKNLNGYADYSISDYWDEISHGEFDVIADVYHIILPYDYNHYNNDIYEVHRDVYKVLDTTLYVDWRRYDKWRWNINTQEYENIGDDYIDMMVIQHRSVDMFGATYGGIAGLFASYNTLNYGKYIDGGASSYEASGFTGIDGAIMWKGDFTGLCVHEYSHFAVLMAHRPYSKVAGGEVKDMLISYANCCNPIPGEDIIGFITKTEGVKIHKKSCKNLANLFLMDADRIIDVQWPEQTDDEFFVGIKISGEDKPGMLNEITQAIASQDNTNIKSVNITSRGSTFDGSVILMVKNINHLNQLVDKIKSISGVFDVRRFFEE